MPNRNIKGTLKKILYEFALILKLIRKVNLIYWLFAKKGSLHSVNIGSIKIKIRKGSTDFRVAISSQTELQAIEYSLPKDYSKVIVDAGGYIGTAAIALSEMFPMAQIISIEASKENYEILKLNCAGFPNIICLNNALSCTSGKTHFLSDRGTGNWGFSIVDNPKDKSNPTKKHTITTITINDIKEKYGNIDLIKLDIEGSEKELFENDIMLNSIKIIIVELHERIVKGCVDAFSNFNRTRTVIKNEGEKFISVK